MKYVCTVCGYIYDDAEHETPFESLPDDWKCPLCKAPKSLFEKVEEQESKPVVKEKATSNASIKEIKTSEDEDLIPLNAGELSILFSNLARGCEKQYKEEAKACFDELASYFEDLVPDDNDANLGQLANLIQKDLDSEYANLKSKAEAASDRGTLRIVTWGDKVTRIAKSLIDRYLKEGDAFLSNTELYICTVCGFLYVGDNPPETCPVCRVPSWKFEKIKGRAKK